MQSGTVERGRLQTQRPEERDAHERCNTSTSLIPKAKELPLLKEGFFSG